MSSPSGASDARACVVFNGSDAQAVAHAIRLVGFALYHAKTRDAMALLMCKRSSWDSAVRIFGKGMTDSFEMGSSMDTFSCNEAKGCGGLKRPICEIIKECFGDTHQSSVDHSAGKEERTDDVPRESESASSREENLKRLLVRFIDEEPLNVAKKEHFPTNSVAPNSEGLLWKYIGAANDMSMQIDDIALVVVAGLSQIQNDLAESGHYVDPKGSSYGDAIIHPFTATGVVEHGDRIHRTYNTKYILGYSLSIATTLNALNKNESCPNFVLFEPLPTDTIDEKKFTSFLLERFGNVHHIKELRDSDNVL